MWFVGLAKVNAREFYEVEDAAAREVPKVGF
jgi:hypothetical protein